MPSLQELLDASAARHHHLCPRQVLGVQMGRRAGELLGLALPQHDKRLLTIVETDGCFTDGVSVATNCWVGRRTMRVEDYGKVAAVFVDTQLSRAVRLAPRADVRQAAPRYAPDAANRWEAMLLGYQRMAPADLFTAQPVRLTTSLAWLIGQPGMRVVCDRCGEEILNGREVQQAGSTLCRACAGHAYYAALPSLEAAGTDSAE